MIVDCTPLYVQILEQIEDEICTGKWQEGKRIPSVSELAHQYQVAPQTVSHSLHLLVQRGILKPKRGIGMVICAGSVQQLKQEKNGCTSFPDIPSSERSAAASNRTGGNLRYVKLSGHVSGWHALL